MRGGAPGDARGAILELLAARGAGKTICPSEARLIGGVNWRDAMPEVHDAVRSLARAGVVEVRQGGERREAGAIVGAYRVASRGLAPSR